MDVFLKEFPDFEEWPDYQEICWRNRCFCISNKVVKNIMGFLGNEDIELGTFRVSKAFLKNSIDILMSSRTIENQWHIRQFSYVPSPLVFNLIAKPNLRVPETAIILFMFQCVYSEDTIYLSHQKKYRYCLRRIRESLKETKYELNLWEFSTEYLLELAKLDNRVFNDLELATTRTFAVLFACFTGNLVVLKNIVSEYMEKGINDIVLKLLLHLSLAGGDLETVKYVMIDLQARNFWKPCYARLAICTGQLEVIKYLHEELTVYVFEKHNSIRNITDVVNFKEMKILQYMVEKGVFGNHEARYINRCFLNVVLRLSRVEILKYLLEKTQLFDDQKPKFERVLLNVGTTRASRNSNKVLDILEEYISKNYEPVVTEQMFGEAPFPHVSIGRVRFLIECKKENVEKVKEMIDEGYDPRTSLGSILWTVSAIGNVARKGEVLKYLLNLYACGDLDEKMRQNIICAVCKYGNIELVKYVFENNMNRVNGLWVGLVKGEVLDACFKRATIGMADNYVETVKYLVEVQGLDLSKSENRKEVHSFFAIQYGKGRYELLKYFLEERKFRTRKEDVVKLFCTAAIHSAKNGYFTLDNLDMLNYISLVMKHCVDKKFLGENLNLVRNMSIMVVRDEVGPGLEKHFRKIPRDKESCQKRERIFRFLKVINFQDSKGLRNSKIAEKDSEERLNYVKGNYCEAVKIRMKNTILKVCRCLVDYS